ncbi:MAG TPA: HNH endonuclease signature motif containing protein [Candidatus Saccharimonadales bacterium]
MPERRLYIHRAEYLKKAVTKRRRAVRKKLVEYKGGECMLCGYNKCIDALDLHHIDPNQKLFGVSSGGLTRAWNKVVEEADKCVLICANCHREVHAGIVEVQPV